tara:strand:+ start:3762 stop:4499 length:738 start_codon:yes stop_codon:yes gene_type:complete
MCFSTEIDSNIKTLSKRFKAQADKTAYDHFNKLMKIQKGKDGPEKIKEIFNQKRKSKQFVNIPGKDNRVFPNYFAPVIISVNGQRLIRPMRYRIRPKNSLEEIPSKYNVFNARLDSLEKRKTWNTIFGITHGIFPFKSFFEWVEDNGKKRLIKFTPNNHKLMWAPCLYDTWSSVDGQISIESFAIITNEPPKEVHEAGHDRCPIFLKEENIESWLAPANTSKDKLYEILGEKCQTYFNNEWATMS